MSKIKSAKYYQERKSTKKALENLSIEKKEKKSSNRVVSVTNISQKIKNINWLSVEKIYKLRKIALL